MPADAFPDAHGRKETNLVASIIQAQPDPGKDRAIGSFDQQREERQQQKSMGDGAAHWRLRGTRGVNMDELEVAGHFGKRVDTRLIDTILSEFQRVVATS